MTPELHNALRIVRTLRDTGMPVEDAIGNSAVPVELRKEIQDILAREETIILTPARLLTAHRHRGQWLVEADRSAWYYWPRLREYLLDTKNWPEAVVRSIDDATDRILGQLELPTTTEFDIRGLVLGFVQSGKTANFSALIAKAADAGYRLIIVLSGIHNNLRKQTQSRLMKELVGYADGRTNSVPLPPQGQRWFTFTSEALDGDFDPGVANYGALQGTQPVLMVVKKVGAVLRRLHEWLDAAPADVRRTLPIMVVDDEADQASVNVGGNRPGELGEQDSDDDDDPDPTADSTPPSVINDLIRQLLTKFHRTAYVAYTATPFANVLIPHTAVDKVAGEELYPRDFIVDLPRPSGYFGSEEIFGREDSESVGLDIIREIPKADLPLLLPERARDAVTFQPGCPPSLEDAILDFVLSGAARRQRGDGDQPCTMLVHTSLRTIVQSRLTEVVRKTVADMRDEWRYQRQDKVQPRLSTRWTEEFRPLVKSLHNPLDIPFGELSAHVGPFLEQIQVKQINSNAEDELDYEAEPSLKTIVVGGNRLSRGLTLEGLAVSYYARRTAQFDTLMQMGRWFGFREGYEDLTRIYMTEELEGWFQDLAEVEHRLREDIQVYEKEGVTPLDLGPRILKHPAMLVTSRLKMKHAQEIIIAQSYAGEKLQTTIFPFERAEFLTGNIEAVRHLLSTIDRPDKEPYFRTTYGSIIDFLDRYRIDADARTLAPGLIKAFIQRQAEQKELTNWIVCVEGLQREDPALGTIDLLGADKPLVNLIRRTRLRSRPNSLGVITDPKDEEVGLTAEQLAEARRLEQVEHYERGPALRKVRLKTEGVLSIYPISRNSGHGSKNPPNRLPIFINPNHGTHVMGIAISFPSSNTAATVRGQYLVGTVGWRSF